MGTPTPNGSPSFLQIVRIDSHRKVCNERGGIRFLQRSCYFAGDITIVRETQMAKTKEQHRLSLVALLESLDADQIAKFSDLVVWLRSVQLALEHESTEDPQDILEGILDECGGEELARYLDRKKKRLTPIRV